MSALASASTLGARDPVPVPEVVPLDFAKHAELIADYPNPAWGSKNWFINTVVQLEDNLYTYGKENNARTFFLFTAWSWAIPFRWRMRSPCARQYAVSRTSPSPT